MKNIKTFEQYSINEGVLANITTGLIVSILSILPYNLNAKQQKIDFNKTEINSEYLKYVYKLNSLLSRINTTDSELKDIINKIDIINDELEAGDFNNIKSKIINITKQLDKYNKINHINNLKINEIVDKIKNDNISYSELNTYYIEFYNDLKKYKEKIDRNNIILYSIVIIIVILLMGIYHKL